MISNLILVNYKQIFLNVLNDNFCSSLFECSGLCSLWRGVTVVSAFHHPRVGTIPALPTPALSTSAISTGDQGEPVRVTTVRREDIRDQWAMDSNFYPWKKYRSTILTHSPMIWKSLKTISIPVTLRVNLIWHHTCYLWSLKLSFLGWCILWRDRSSIAASAQILLWVSEKIQSTWSILNNFLKMKKISKFQKSQTRLQVFQKKKTTTAY